MEILGIFNFKSFFCISWREIMQRWWLWRLAGVKPVNWTWMTNGQAWWNRNEQSWRGRRRFLKLYKASTTQKLKLFFVHPIVRDFHTKKLERLFCAVLVNENGSRNHIPFACHECLYHFYLFQLWIWIFAHKTPELWKMQVLKKLYASIIVEYACKITMKSCLGFLVSDMSHDMCTKLSLWEERLW